MKRQLYMFIRLCFIIEKGNYFFPARILFLMLIFFTLSACGDSSGQKIESNSAPEADNISIFDENGGFVNVGDTLKASYDYYDADGDSEGNSVYQWSRDGIDIDDAVSLVYNVNSE